MSFTIKAFNLAGRFSGGLLAIIKKILWPAIKFILKFLVVPIYGRYLWFKNKISKKAANPREKIILIFTNRYIVHILIIAIALGVVASNLLAYEKSEDYGRGALINKFIQIEDIETIEDTVDAQNISQINNYQGEGSLLTSNAFTEAQRKEEQVASEQDGLGLAMTQGGNTLIKPELASTESAKIGSRSVKEYVVKEGDAVSAISDRFNLSVETILWANNLTIRSYIKPGQKLIIPPVDGVLHKITKGDTIAKIAKKYQAVEAQIRNFNYMDDASLAVGDIIIVPGGKIIAVQRPQYAGSQTTVSSGAVPPLPAGSTMYWPSVCRRITQYFRNWRHTGVDIACAVNSEIRAAQSGVVSRVQYSRVGYGNNITINHGSGKQTLYGHLNKIYVTAGQTVSAGQVIGSEGSTGRSTGPHLHFEVLINGARVNPLNYVR
ncbi:MAG: peptidoglycan DD-metalloendopeptidase family protein [Patescibacteria group bacterium]